MRRTRVIVAALLILVICAAFAAPAVAAPAKNLRCTFNAVLRFAPGISATPGAEGTFSGSGPIVCQRQPTAPAVLVGTVGFAGTTAPGGDCAAGAGSGTLTATLAAADGTAPTVLTVRFTFLRDGLALNGPATGTGNDMGLGTLGALLVPGLNQNCVVTPIRQANATGVLAFTGLVV